MTHFARTIAASLAAALIATPILAQERQRVSSECRQEIVTLCASDGQRDRAKIRSCVRENFSKLSEPCAAEIKARMQAAQQNGAKRKSGS